MDAYKLSVKFFVEDTASLRESEFVPIFHSWIQTHAIDDHLLIDVADYSHVVEGPGTVLVAHEANYYMDKAGGRLGLTYTRKQPLPGDFSQRLAATFRAALAACSRLERAMDGRLKFTTDEAIFRINDRLLAADSEQTFTEVSPDLQKFVADLYAPASVALQHQGNPQQLFEVGIKASQFPPLTKLLDRLGQSILGFA